MIFSWLINDIHIRRKSRAFSLIMLKLGLSILLCRSCLIWFWDSYIALVLFVTSVSLIHMNPKWHSSMLPLSISLRTNNFFISFLETLFAVKYHLRHFLLIVLDFSVFYLFIFYICL